MDNVFPSPVHPRRLAIILSHPVQYYAPWFRHLAAQPDLDVTVFYLEPRDPRRDPDFGGREEWDRDLLDGYRSRVLRNRSPRRDVGRFWGLCHPGLARVLRPGAFDAILLFGYAYCSAWLTLLLARATRIPVLLRGDSHDLGRVPSAASVRRAAFVFRRCAGFLSPGQAHDAYLRRRGVSASQIFRCPHAVDREWFDPDRAGVADAAAEVRRRLGLATEAPLVLFAGKWIPKKQPVEFVQAFLAVAPAAARLLFVGAGELEPPLRELAASDPRIQLEGFVNQSRLPAYYLAADVFALPSGGAFETWGLAVNEAMEMGTPSLVTEVVGCQRDLVTPGVTGWVAAPAAMADLQATLASALAAAVPDRAGWRHRVRERIQPFSYAMATAGLRQALATVLTRP